MSRILAGRDKGRRLVAPAGTATRPTGARVRKSLFDILAPRLPGCRFLDLCAGSGGVGFEALSRGAAKVVLVERAAEAALALRTNAEALRVEPERLAIRRQEARVALRGLAASGLRFDIVFLDPPYEGDLYEELLGVLGEGVVLADGAVVIAEHFHKRALPERIGRLRCVRSVRIGDHRLSFFGAGDPEHGADAAMGARPEGDEE